MKVTAIQTRKVIPGKDRNLFSVLDEFLPQLKERVIVAVTSKIVSICESRVVKNEPGLKDRLIVQEADYYLPRTSSKYDVVLTIKGGAMSFSSGIDESNGAGFLILWPKNPQKSANDIRMHLQKKHNVKNLGVIITDTSSIPLRWGQRGVFVLAYTGFAPLNSYIGKPDIFGRKLKMTSASIADALGTSSVLVMGEGKEQTPLVVIEDIPFVRFQSKHPTKSQLQKLKMPLQDDLYEPLLTSVKWKKGGGGFKI